MLRRRAQVLDIGQSLNQTWQVEQKILLAPVGRRVDGSNSFNLGFLHCWFVDGRPQPTQRGDETFIAKGQIGSMICKSWPEFEQRSQIGAVLPTKVGVNGPLKKATVSSPVWSRCLTIEYPSFIRAPTRNCSLDLVLFGSVSSGGRSGFKMVSGGRSTSSVLPKLVKES
ncbi:hypothetical protein HG531_004866 [Fusarium graminearum]|nr:hypothetical protein HG531_004866 [Fusarium graminearum]